MTVLLETTGRVANPKSFDFESLARLPGQVADVAALIPGRKGGGVPLRTILDETGPLGDVRYMTLQTADASYSASIPLKAVADQGLIVYRMGDEPVPEEEGGPVRFFIIDVESCSLGAGEIDRCANVKFLHRIDFSAERGPDSRPATEEQHERIHDESDPRPLA
jgi:hypothetical protein